MEDVQRIAESLALRLGRSVAIDDRQMRLLAHTAHQEPVDDFRVRSIMNRQATPGQSVTEYALTLGIETADGPVRVPANPEIGSLARVCVPVRCRTMLLGYLWLMDSAPESPVTESDLDLAADAARAAGEALLRERLIGDVRRAQEGQLLRDLLGSDIAVRDHAANRLRTDWDVPAKAGTVVLAIAVADGGPPGSEVAIDLVLRRAQRRLAPTTTFATTMGATRGTLLVADPRVPDHRRLAESAGAIHRELCQELGTGADVRIGIGPVHDTLTDAADSHQCARDAVRVAQALPDSSPVMFWSELGIYRLLVQLPLEKLRIDAIPSGLRRMIEQDTGQVLVHTLEVFLDAAGDVTSTTAQLNIHRTSLYYRLKRIEDITATSLKKGSDRLSLHLGIKLARLIGLTKTDQA